MKHVKKMSAVPVGMLTVSAVVIAMSLAIQHQASAAPQDYRFVLDGPPAQSDKTVIARVRLQHLPDGKPVPGAIIVQTKFDMGPEGMAEMAAPAKATATGEPGIYRVEAQPSMGGNWALTLTAKIQGEAENVHGSVTIAVPK